MVYPTFVCASGVIGKYPVDPEDLNVVVSVTSVTVTIEPFDERHPAAGL